MTDSRVPDLSTVESPPRRDIDYGTISDGDPIGSGGQALVRRIELPGDQPPRTVAVKEPLAPSETLSRDEIESFFREARTWRTLDTREREKQVFADSEHVVGIVDIGEEVPWVAMEYMDGGGLDERLAAHPDGLPVAEALWIGECLCRGVKLAHDYGVAHLDLKPANVLFRATPGDDWDVPKIADWGLARVLLEQSGSVEALSVEYAAPEQFDADRFGDPDKYTDIYQLGALVYAMLTGQPPYTGSQAGVMHDVVHGDDPVPPSDHRPDLPAGADEAVLTALATAKAERYRGEVGRFGERLQALRASARREVTPRADSWPMFQGGPVRTGYHPTASGPKRSVRTHWTVTTGAGVESSPAVAEGTVYVGSNDNCVYAIDVDTGTLEWSVETGDRVIASPAVADGTVYVGSADAHVYAVDADTGARRWAVETGDQVTASPAVADGTVYVGSQDNRVYAVDAGTGALEWTVETGGRVRSSPAVADGTVYVGSTDDHVYALDAEAGVQQWAVETGDMVLSSPAVADGTVYVGSVDDHVYALDAETGAPEWAVETGDRVYSSPAVADGTVYVGSNDHRVYAIDVETGSRQWAVETGDRVRSSPAVADGTVYVGSWDNYVYGLDAETGAQSWAVETGDWVVSSPAVVDGTVCVGSYDGNTYALTDR